MWVVCYNVYYIQFYLFMCDIVCCCNTVSNLLLGGRRGQWAVRGGVGGWCDVTSMHT